MKTRKNIILLAVTPLAISLFSSCVSQQDPMKSCISIPQSSNKDEREAAAKLSASLIGDIGTPSLEGSYKRAVDKSYASLSQNTLDQLVVAQFIICAKKHHSDTLSPETLASLEKSLTIAVQRAAGARSYGKSLSDSVKAEVLASPRGLEKLTAIENALK